MRAHLRWFFRPTPASVLVYVETLGLAVAVIIRSI